MKTNLFPSGDDGAELAAAEKAFLESLSTDAPPNGFRLFCILVVICRPLQAAARRAVFGSSSC
jgi:hypothetical protein